MKKIGIASDHVGVEYKDAVIKHIKDTYDYEVIDYGPNSTERFDYPLSGEVVGRAVVSGDITEGILICGTGVGIGLAATKVDGVRTATCSEPYTAQLSKEHNNSNVLSFGSRVVGIDLALMMVDAWLNAEFEGGRHQRRIDMLADIEKRK